MMNRLGTETQKAIVNSFNEWDPLEEVIVGCVDYACIPEWHIILQATMPTKQWPFFKQYGGEYFPQELLRAAADELDNFVAILESEGITVRRPDPVDWSASYKTPDFGPVRGLYAAMPRDFMLVIGDEIIESPMAWRSRHFESRAYRPLIKTYFHEGAKWTAAPKPQLSEALYRENCSLEQDQFVVTEFEPVFDAADFIRCGRDIFCQRSHVTNQFGIDWLKRYLEPEYTIHILNFNDPQAMHIDATFVPLAPGRLLLNPNRRTVLPKMFDSWEILTPPPPSIPDDHPLYFTSKWVSINVLSLDEKRVVVEKQEEPLIQFLEQCGFQPIPVPFRNFMSFGGSFHCATSDIRRQGNLQSYFN